MRTLNVSLKNFVIGIAAALIAIANPASAQAQTAIDCEEAYNLIFGALNGKRPDGKPASARSDVPDGAISWALDYENSRKSSAASCTPPSGILGAYLRLVEADARRLASVAASPVSKAMGGERPVEATDKFGMTATDYYDLGEAYVLTDSLPQAHKEYTVACNMGHTRACYEASGQGDPKGEGRTIAFWADGCRRGDARACAKIDKLKAGMRDVRLLIPMRLSAAEYAEMRGDYDEAKRIYSGLCEEGYGRGCYDQARILETVDKTSDKAAIARLYKRGCALDYDKACN